MALVKNGEVYSSCSTGFDQPEANDCCVRAFSLAANISYSEAHSIFRDAGRKNGRGTSAWIVHKVLVTKKATLVAEAGLAKASKGITLAAFLRCFPRGNYFVVRTGHAFAVIDGVVHDWGFSDTGARSRVRFAYRLK